MNQQPADLILHNGKIATQDDRRSIVEAAAIRDGKFLDLAYPAFSGFDPGQFLIRHQVHPDNKISAPRLA
jgi:hypothetical protein